MTGYRNNVCQTTTTFKYFLDRKTQGNWHRNYAGHRYNVSETYTRLHDFVGAEGTPVIGHNSNFRQTHIPCHHFMGAERYTFYWSQKLCLSIHYPLPSIRGGVKAPLYASRKYCVHIHTNFKHFFGAVRHAVTGHKVMLIKLLFFPLLREGGKAPLRLITVIL